MRTQTQLGDTELVTSKHKKQAQSKPHQKQKCQKEKRNGGDPDEIRQKKSVKDTFIKWNGKKKKTQNKAGASAGEDNP